MRERISEAYRRDGLWFLTSAPGFALRQAGTALDWACKGFLQSRRLNLAEDTTRDRPDIREFRYGRSEAVTVSTDHCLGTPPERVYQFTGRYTFPKPRVFEVRDAQIVGYPNIVPFTSSGTPLISSTETETWMDKNLSYIFDNTTALSLLWFLYTSRSLPSRPGLTEYDTVLPVVDQSCLTYGHWINVYLPMLEAAEQYEKHTGTDVKLLIHPSSPTWMCDSLTLLGFDKANLIEWVPGRARARRLLLPVPRFRYGRGYGPTDEAKMHPVYSRTGHEWMRERILSHVRPPESAEFSENIYISRQNTARRRVVNESQVMGLLQEYGYESYAPETMSFEDQVRLFAQARNIIGAHGSALVTTVFSTEHTLLELYSDAVGFDPLVNSRNGQYSSLECRTVLNEGDENDIYVEVDALESHINEYGIF